MEVDQGKFIAHLRAVIVAQFQDFKLTDCVVDVTRIPRPSIGFAPSLSVADDMSGLGSARSVR